MSKYVLAISGGIDSTTLLWLTATSTEFRKANFPGAVWPEDFIVATFDHGIRGEASRKDAEFVCRLARKYGVGYCKDEGHLSADCSEELAREKRHDFLRVVADVLGKDAKIVTAHHADDLLETAVMNLIRGTGWRGLAPMYNQRIVRPLLRYTKADLARLAIENNLTWVEDQTNYQPRYFRNRVRSVLNSVSAKDKRQLLKIIHEQLKLRPQIEEEIAKLKSSLCYEPNTICRYYLIMLPESVALELLRAMTNSQLTRPQLMQLLLFAKVAKPHKRMLWKTVTALVDKRYLYIMIAN